MREGRPSWDARVEIGERMCAARRGRVGVSVGGVVGKEARKLVRELVAVEEPVEGSRSKMARVASSGMYFSLKLGIEVDAGMSASFVPSRRSSRPSSTLFVEQVA